MGIGVMMTVRNGGEYLHQSIDSILAQSLMPDAIVIVDDGSTDQTPHILDEYATRFPFIKVIKTKGVGRSKALNLAWTNLEADWVANLDADDVWLPHKLESQIQAVNIFPDFEAFATGSAVTREIPAIVRVGIASGESYRLARQSLFTKNPVNHSSVLLKRDLLERLGGYDESLSKLVDKDLWIRIYKSGKSFIILKDLLTIKRIHSNQSFERSNRWSYLTSALKMDYKALHALGAPHHYFIFPLIKFAYGILPSSVRFNIRRLGQLVAGSRRS